QFSFAAGRIHLVGLMDSRYERLTAEIDWGRARAGVGKEKRRLRTEALPVLRPPDAAFDFERSTLTEQAKAEFGGLSADLCELAPQRPESARSAYQGHLESFLAGKEWLSVIFASAVHVVEADLAVSGDKADAAALRERAWEMAWITHEIIR